MTKIKLTLAALLLSLAACDADGSTELERAPAELPVLVYDLDCEQGELGCECFDGNFCAAGGGCVDGLCQACEVGGNGCDCRADWSCDDGLRCEPESLFCRPE